MVGSPTALGGHFDGMERTPAELRALGLEARLRARPGLAGVDLRDAGDVDNQPGWAPDPDPRAKNRERICAYLPRLADHVAAALRDDHGVADRGTDARLLVVGGDCTTHAGAMAGIRRARPGITPRDRLVRRPRRFQHPGHDAVGQRLGHALRDDLRPRRGRSAGGLRRAHGPRGGCRAARRPGPRRGRVADAGGLAGGPFRGGHAGRRRRPGGTRGVGPNNCRPGRRFLRRVRPRRAGRLLAAGRWRCPSRAGCRSRRRSRPSGRSQRPGP